MGNRKKLQGNIYFGNVFVWVKQRKKIISEFKNGQHNLENMVIFICDDEFVLMKAMGVKTQTETWQPNGLLLHKIWHMSH